MTPPEPPSSLLERAAQRLDNEGGMVTRPIAEWLREVAEAVQRRAPESYNEERAVDVATAILGEPVPGEDEK